MTMLTRRRFCEIALAAPAIAGKVIREPNVTSDNLRKIEQVENSLMELRDGKAVRVNVALRERMQQQHVPGLSIAVIDGYEIAWTKSYGVLEQGALTPVTAETLFAAGSISKPVSTAAALKLVEKGRLKLDEDVNAKLRSWKVPENEFTKTEKVTLRRLLSHSAGLNGVVLHPLRLARRELPCCKRLMRHRRRTRDLPTARRNQFECRQFPAAGSFTRPADSRS